MSAACFLAKAGVQVRIVEKNDKPGGRGRAFYSNGFTYDMGPSWYWMPDVFERFFAQFGKQTKDYYELVRLDPSYRVFWKDEWRDVPASMPDLQAFFESYEPGAGGQLFRFLNEAARKYKTAMSTLVFKPGLSLIEFARIDVLQALLQIDLLDSIHNHVRKFFRHPKLIQLAEFPILFLGALPKNTPALYSLMNHADMALGTWYPQGGMVRISEAMHALACSLGVEFYFERSVSEIVVRNRRAVAVETTSGSISADAVIAACDYHHADQHLLAAAHRNYSDAYWQSRKMAPSCILYYLGFNKKLDGLAHHNLLFDAPFDEHAEALYKHARFPEHPLMYICCPSKTDPGVAPEGFENVFVLIPVAPGLEVTEIERNRYLDVVMNRLSQKVGYAVRDYLVYLREYSRDNFIQDYNAFKGNAYGLANTLLQTAILKPAIRNKNVRNLYYTGQLTVPGPGVPPAIISGEIVAGQVVNTFNR